MLTYRGGGGSRRRSSSASSRDTASWISVPAVRWAPVLKSVALRCAFVLVAVPVSVIGLLLLRLLHGVAVRICIALLSLLPKGCPGLLYSSDNVSSPPTGRVYMFELDRGRDPFDVIQSLIEHDPRFGMKLVYSLLGSNVWKKCDDSWNFRDQVQEGPSPDVSLAACMERILSEPPRADMPPWKAVRGCEGRVLVLCVHRSLAGALKRCDDPEPCLYTPKKDVDPLVVLSRTLEKWMRLWFSHPTLVLHRVRSQFSRDSTWKDYLVASTRIIPTSFLDALAVQSERPCDEVLLSCVAGALRRSFQYLRGSLPQDSLAGSFTRRSDEGALLFPLWNADPVTRVQRIASALKDPLRVTCQVIVARALATGWRLPGGETLRSLHDWTLDPSGVHVQVHETKGGLYLDIACHKMFLERPDILAAAFEREVQDLSLGVGLHRYQVTRTSLTTSASESQLTEKDFWSTKFQHVYELHRRLAKLVFTTQ